MSEAQRKLYGDTLLALRHRPHVLGLQDAFLHHRRLVLQLPVRLRLPAQAKRSLPAFKAEGASFLPRYEAFLAR